MRTLLRILLPVVIGAGFLLIVLLFSGCSAPTYLQVAYVHQSHPDAGPGPWPVGGPSPETTIDGIEGAVGIERGLWFGEAGLMYDVRDRNLKGGPLTATFRMGVRVRK